MAVPWVYAIPFLIRPGTVLEPYSLMEHKVELVAQILHGESAKGGGGPPLMEHEPAACPPLRPWRPCRRVLVNVYNSIGLPVHSSNKILHQQLPG
jgi:hypothetical protein